RSRIHPDKHSVPTGRSPMLNDFLQTFRPYGTVPPMLNGCYKHFVPTGRFPRSTIVLQTFRPAGTVPTFYDCATNIPSLRDGPPMLNDCYKHFVPTGRFPRLYDCATNVPSRWDGFLRSKIVLHIWSRWDRLVADLRSVRNGNFGG